MSSASMWVTLDLLVDRRSTRADEDLDEWLDSVTRVQVPSGTDTPTSAGIPELPRDFTREREHRDDCCSFSHPHIRSRLERLMGSSIVRITDRRYMQKLQERITDEYLDEQKKRIKEREADESNREKQLILDGKMALDDVPEELASHPVVKVSKISRMVIQERRSKMSMLSKKSSVTVFATSLDDNSEVLDTELAAVSGLTPSVFKPRMSIMPVFGKKDSMQVITDENMQKVREEVMMGEDDIAKGYMFTPEDYDKLKYEAEEIKELKGAETVDEMYRLADEIIGPLRMFRPLAQEIEKMNKQKKHAEE